MTIIGTIIVAIIVTNTDLTLVLCISDREGLGTRWNGEIIRNRPLKSSKNLLAEAAKKAFPEIISFYCFIIILP